MIPGAVNNYRSNFGQSNADNNWSDLQFGQRALATLEFELSLPGLSTIAFGQKAIRTVERQQQLE